MNIFASVCDLTNDFGVNQFDEKLLYLSIKVKIIKGISYLTDSKNRKVAVQIDLKKHGELWEEFYDNMIAEQRKDEEKLPLNDVIRLLKKEGKLDDKI